MNNVIKTLFAGSTGKELHGLLIRSGANMQLSIKIIIPLTAMNLSGIVNILVMVTVIYGIRNTHYHPPKFLVL